ncbi:MAG: polymer-forming cytoskeletal protein [Cypionkella sp.]
MFSKTAEPSMPPTRPTTAPASSHRSTLAPDIKITGEISSTGTIEVLGEIDGSVTASTLIVGAEGRIAGTVSAETVEVKGRLDGQVSCRSFTLRAAAQVTADVNYTTLVIENGARIEGRFTLGKP